MGRAEEDKWTYLFRRPRRTPRLAPLAPYASTDPLLGPCSDMGSHHLAHLK